MNITTTSSGKLDLLARRIRNDIDLRAHSRDEWITATLDLSAALAEAKNHFKDTQSFGRWLDDNEFDIGKNERVAYIAFGADLERAREILGRTESRSVQLIYNKEFRVPNARNSTKAKTGPRLTTTPEVERALAAYDAFKAVGVEPTQTQVEERAGVSSTPVRRAIERRRTEAALASEGGDISDLPKTAKEKAEAAVRKIQKKLDYEFDQRVQEAVRKHVNEFILPMYKEKLELADRVLATGKKPFTIEEYRKLLGALHPDSSSVEKRTEMFMIVKAREAQLRPMEKDKPMSGDLPATIEELLARRKKR